MIYRLRFRTTVHTAPLHTGPMDDVLAVLERKWLEDEMPYFLESQPEAKADGQTEWGVCTILTHYLLPDPLVVKDPRRVIDLD
jgi:hypothetical protein